jgi:hypothetical protein
MPVSLLFGSCWRGDFGFRDEFDLDGGTFEVFVEAVLDELINRGFAEGGAAVAAAGEAVQEHGNVCCFKAATSSSLCAKGTRASLVPCRIRNGGLSLLT